MTPLDPTSFLLSLAFAIAQIDGSVTLGSSLWVHQAIEQPAAPAYGVLRNYAGPAPDLIYAEARQLSIQCMVIAPSAVQALALSQRIFETLYCNVQGNRRTRSNWTLDAKKIDSITREIVDDASLAWFVRSVLPAQEPGILSVDDRGKTEAAFNFDVRVQALMAA